MQKPADQPAAVLTAGKASLAVLPCKALSIETKASVSMNTTTTTTKTLPFRPFYLLDFLSFLGTFLKKCGRNAEKYFSKVSAGRSKLQPIRARGALDFMTTRDVQASKIATASARRRAADQPLTMEPADVELDALPFFAGLPRGRARCDHTKKVSTSRRPV